MNTLPEHGYIPRVVISILIALFMVLATEVVTGGVAVGSMGTAVGSAGAAVGSVGVAAPRWRCVYEFTARTPDELSLQPGDAVSEI